MLKFIKQALSEVSNSSSIRLFNFISLMFFVPAITFGYIWNVVTDNAIQWGYAVLICGLITGILAIKVWQKGKENKGRYNGRM